VAPFDRRGLLALALGAVAASTTRATLGRSSMTTRPIPKSGERIPCVGLGTFQTFDVGSGANERGAVAEVLKAFFAAGGRVIDSSPMYGRAEQVAGDTVTAIGAVGTPFLATKVWTRGKTEGIAQMERSFRLMRTKRMDLMQVHNLVDVKTHLPVLREWKQAGKIRYLGVTHYSHGAFDELERLMRTEALDFVQLPYSLGDREAERRLLPCAADTGTAVLVMRPFKEGALFKRVSGKALPAWAPELECTSFAQLFLKFILGHPAVTCPIPATSKPKHLADNVRAGFGPLPDEAMRRKLVKLLDG
jgi:aryl-alcohol dehydrogenase-like predicted oxidoreductase